MTGAVVEGAEIAQPLQSPGSVVAGDEVADRCLDLGGGAEGLAVASIGSAIAAVADQDARAVAGDVSWPASPGAAPAPP